MLICGLQFVQPKKKAKKISKKQDSNDDSDNSDESSDDDKHTKKVRLNCSNYFTRTAEEEEDERWEEFEYHHMFMQFRNGPQKSIMVCYFP